MPDCAESLGFGTVCSLKRLMALIRSDESPLLGGGDECDRLDGFFYGQYLCHNGLAVIGVFSDGGCDRGSSCTNYANLSVDDDGYIRIRAGVLDGFSGAGGGSRFEVCIAVGLAGRMQEESSSAPWIMTGPGQKKPCS